ncbi:MAG: NAD(P)H-hydrate epimerase [Phycisphaerae bacterium]
MQGPDERGEPLTCNQIRELDVLTIEHIGVPGIVLMENASRAVADFIRSTLIDPARARIVIACGPGNNGGDGFAAARHLHNAGARVLVALAVAPTQVRGDAATNLHILERMGIEPVAAYEPAGFERVVSATQSADVVVDALLGSGARGAPRGVIAALIEVLNAAPRAGRIAVDIPSGLDADTGAVAQPCFVADATVTFVAAKVGFSTPAARTVLGRVLVADIGIPRALIPGLPDPTHRA